MFSISSLPCLGSVVRDATEVADGVSFKSLSYARAPMEGAGAGAGARAALGLPSGGHSVTVPKSLRKMRH